MAYSGSAYLNPSNVSPGLLALAKNAGIKDPNIESRLSAVLPKPDTNVSPGMSAIWQQYLDNAYKGVAPSRLRDIDRAVKSGSGITEYGLNAAIYEDAAHRGPYQDLSASDFHKLTLEQGNNTNSTIGPYYGTTSFDDIKPILSDYNKSSLGGLYSGIDRNTVAAQRGGVPSAAIDQFRDMSIKSTTASIVDGDIVQHGGIGSFASIAGLAALPFGAPALSALAGIATSVQNESILGALASIASPALPELWDKTKSGIKNRFGGGGFVNPQALGLAGDNLSVNFGTPTSWSPVSGYGASALGLTGEHLSLPGLSTSLTSAIDGFGLGDVRENALNLYRSQALGELRTAGASESIIKSISESIEGLFTGGDGATAGISLSPGGQIQGSGGGLSASTALLPYNSLKLPDRIQQELDNPFPVFGKANGIQFPSSYRSLERLRPFNQQARGKAVDFAQGVERQRRAA